MAFPFRAVSEWAQGERSERLPFKEFSAVGPGLLQTTTCSGQAQNDANPRDERALRIGMAPYCRRAGK